MRGLHFMDQSKASEYVDLKNFDNLFAIIRSNNLETIEVMEISL